MVEPKKYDYLLAFQEIENPKNVWIESNFNNPEELARLIIKKSKHCIRTRLLVHEIINQNKDGRTTEN